MKINIRYIKAILLIPLLINSISFVNAQYKKDPNNVIRSFEKCVRDKNLEDLSLYFSEKLDINVINTSVNCSKSQAYQILKKFFNDYGPTDFEIVYHIDSSPIEYVVGTLSCGGNKFEVALAIIDQGSRQKIQQISIEQK